MVTVRVPATSANLGPGFDTLGMALELYNTVEMAEAPAGVRLYVEGEGAEALSRRPDNLVVSAAERLFAECGRSVSGLIVRLVNRIPVSRGLGSSATAIVGGLVAANHLVGSPLGTDDLLELAVAMEGHADNVTPALMGGVTVACNTGGRTRYLRFDPPPDLALGVIIPDRPLSTAEARRVLPDRIPREDAVYNLQRACLLVGALQAGRLDLIGEALGDRLHQPYRVSLLPGLDQVLSTSRRPGLLGACLSGSGSTVLVFLDPAAGPAERDQAVEDLAGAFRAHKIGCHVLSVRPALRGAQIDFAHGAAM